MTSQPVSPNSLPKLPVELCEAIIDSARDLDDYTTLRNCARVGKQWLPRSRRHLWRTLFIDNPGQLEPLREVLKGTPEIRDLVAEVVANTLVYGTRFWQTHDSAPLVLLPFLPKLQRWHIRYLTYTDTVPFSLSYLSVACLSRYSAIREICIELKFDVFHAPTSLFRLITVLKSLEVLRISASAAAPDGLWSPTSKVTYGSRGRLVELHACFLHPAFTAQLLEANARTLRTVTIDCSATTSVAFSEPHDVHSGVETLLALEPFSMQLSICRHLTSLVLLLHSSIANEESLGSGVKNAASVVRAGLPDTLRTLVIAFNDSRALPFLPPQSTSTISALRDFSETVIDIFTRRAPALSFSFQVVDARRNHIRRWYSALEETFPTLHAHVQPQIAFTSSCVDSLLPAGHVYPDPIMNMSFSPERSLAATFSTSSWDKFERASIVLWDVTRCDPLCESDISDVYRTNAARLSFSADATHLAFAQDGVGVVLFRISVANEDTTLTRLYTFTGTSPHPLAFTWTPYGSQLLTQDPRTSDARAWEISGFSPQDASPPDSLPVSLGELDYPASSRPPELTISTDGLWLLYKGWSRVKRWPSDGPRYPYEASRYPYAEGQWRSTPIVLLNLENHDVYHPQLDDHIDYTEDVVFSPTVLGSHSILAVRRNSVVRWNVEARAVTSTVPYIPPSGAAPLCGISPDANYFLKMGENRVWTVFDANTGVPRFNVGPGPYTGIPYNYIVVFSPDGAFFITHWEDGCLRIWNAERGVRVATLRRRGGDICGVEFSSDGELLALGHEDGTVKFHSFLDILTSGSL